MNRNIMRDKMDSQIRILHVCSKNNWQPWRLQKLLQIDMMNYGVKPSAIRSENYFHNFKASNGPSFDLALGQDIIFDVPALGNVYYSDLQTAMLTNAQHA